MTGQFRGDIQGLRALAVVTILLFHVDFDFAPGGFLGVDIFFVISGFLITGNILRRSEAGTWSAVDFYLRRIRRLVPAAALTVLASLIAGYFILSSSDFEAAGQSGLAALLFSSNFVFWLEAGYFDAASHTKPFLHFWSLSVEEQFYLVWPALMLVAFAFKKRMGVAVGVGVLSLVSLLAAEYLLATDHMPSAFFLMPFRVFEFGIGALLAVLGLKLPGKLFQETAVLVGLALMVASVVVFDAASRMPGFLSLIPLAGCALVILSPEARSGVVFNNPVTRLIGDASYSIYLVHWPLIVFYKYLTSPELSLTAQLILMLVSIILGVAQYHLIETPMRKESFWHVNRLKTGLVAAGAILFVGITGFAGAVWAMNGLPSRFPDVQNVELDREVLRQATLDFRDANNATRAEKRGPPRIYVFGDSFGKDTANLLNTLNPRLVVDHNWIPSSCQGVVADRLSIVDQLPKANRGRAAIAKCQQQIGDGLSAERLAQYDLVVLASAWQVWTLDFIAPTVADIRSKTDVPIVLFSQGQKFRQIIPTFLEGVGTLDDVEAFDASGYWVPDEQFADQARIADELGIYFLERFSVLCPDEACPVIDADTPVAPYYYDDKHISLEGVAYWAEQIRECSEPVCKLLKTGRER